MLASHNRKQPTFLIKKQILSNPKRRMQPYNDNTHNQRQQHIESHVSRHERNNRDEAQNAEHRSILEGSVENNERAIARKEEEEPCDEENQEDDHGDGMPE